MNGTEATMKVIPITSPVPEKTSDIIIGFQTPDRLLYHYTKKATAIDRILRDRTLRFGSITKTNDPKEKKHWQFTPASNGATNLLSVKSEEISKRLSMALKDNTKVACFCRDRQPLSGDHLRDIFLRGWSKPRMWAQYGGDHTGVCLVFERQRLDQAVAASFGFYSKVYRGDVRYVNRSVAYDSAGDFTAHMDEIARLGFDRYVEAHFQAFAGPLFFEKMTDWRDECEFRWIIADKDLDDKCVEISSSLVGVIYGDEAGDDAIREMMALTRDLPVKHMALRWTNSNPWYDFVNPLYSPVAKWGKTDT